MVTHVESLLTSRIPGVRSRREAAESPVVKGKLLARRHQIMSLRRDLVLVDAVLTLIVVGLGLADRRQVAAAMALTVFVAVAAHVCAADSPRSIVSIRSVVRLVAVLAGGACVLVTALDQRDVGRELLLGALCAGAPLVAVRLLGRVPSTVARYGLGQRRRLLVGDARSLETTAARRALVGAEEDLVLVTRADRPGPDVKPSDDASSDRTATDDQRRPRDPRSGPHGLVERVVRTALDTGVERVTVLPGDSWGQQELRELSWLLEGTGVDMVISTDLDGIAPHRVDVTQQDGRLMIRVGSASPRGTQALLKAALDRLAAGVLLVLVAPLMLVVAAAVRLESPGPAIFRQTRVREGGVTFTMYKFRSMNLGAEQQLSDLQELNKHGADRPLFKVENDPRVTRVGHVLRKTSLDELPQLVNVLRGQMSLIGPRPALPLEVAMYDYVARRRLAVKPGMTGLWQVSGRSRLTWDESIGFDLDYVDNWSPGIDAAIVARTFRAVVTKDGAI